MSTPNFDVVVIARNESETLPRLIVSLKDFFIAGGSMHVLDTGSTDGTPEIARGLGCKVTEVGDRFRKQIDSDFAKQINEKFIQSGEDQVVSPGDSLFDFAEARNFAASLAENDMIAMPDCDEIFTKLDLETIQKEIDSGAEQFEYNFVFAHDSFGNPTISFLHSKFYDRRKLFWFGVIHEVLSGQATRKYLDESVIKLEHYQNEKTDRRGYLKGLALDCFLNPQKDRQSHYFAREMLYTGRYRSAIKEFERHLIMNGWEAERSQSLVFIGECYNCLGEPEKAVKAWQEAFTACGDRREPLIRLAEHYRQRNDYKHTAAYASAALSLPKGNFYADNAAHYAQTPHELLYFSLWWLGDKEGSKFHYDKAVSYQPLNPKYAHDRQFYYPVDLPFTGERLVPGATDHRPDLMTEHLARYNFASKFTSGQKVLDAACGAGYGKDIIKHKYTGVDISQEAINHAIKKHGDGFSVANLETLDGLPDERFDITLSFETLEHLSDPKPFIEWVKAHSKLFIFSIPVNLPGEFHKVVYSIEDIKKIGSYFPSVVFFSQKGDVIKSLDSEADYVIAVASIEKLPTISVILPHLSMGSQDREDGLKRCIQSIHDQNYPQELIELLVMDGDGTVPQKVHEGKERSIGEYLIYASNDLEFDRNAFLSAILESKKYDKALVSFNSGDLLPDLGNINEHFLIRKDFLSQIDNEIFDLRFNHVGCDNLLWHKATKLDQAFHSTHAQATHYHFSKGAKMDDVYKKGWGKVEEDRELLKKELDLLYPKTS